MDDPFPGIQLAGQHHLESTLFLENFRVLHRDHLLHDKLIRISHVSEEKFISGNPFVPAAHKLLNTILTP